MILLSIPYINGNEWKYIKDCLDTNWVSSVGSYVDLFERKFSEYLGVDYSIVTSNGTSALHLALRVLGIGEGDEVIVPSLTFIASVNPIKYVGANPVFVDVEADTWNIDYRRIEELITEKTKAIIAVHIYGHPANMEPIMKIAKKYNIYVIEDATEGLGSKYKNKPVGTIGDIGCFSFNGNKLITTGGGGMLVTNDEDLASKAKHLSTQAKVVKNNGAFYHDEIGYNYRLPNILAAMGVAQLEKIDEFINRKRQNAQYYNNLLKGIKGIKIQKEKEWACNCYWLYSIVIEDNYGVDRDTLIKELKKEKIESRPFFYPVHMMEIYRDCKKGVLENTLNLYKKGINLPSSIELSKSNIEKICSVIQQFAK
jgi:perosamine synthetase